MKHNLKIWASFADCVLDGTKTFEVRENDRGFQKGDTIVFEVMDDGGVLHNSFHKLNGKEYTITYVLSGWGIEPGKVAFGIKPAEDNAWLKEQCEFLNELARMSKKGAEE